MEKMNRLSSIRLESKSDSLIESYFQRAGSFGHIAIMVAFYAIIIALSTLI